MTAKKKNANVRGQLDLGALLADMGANLNLDTLDTSVRATKSKQVSNVNEENTESTSLTNIMERLNSAAGAEQNKSDIPDQEENDSACQVNDKSNVANEKPEDINTDKEKKEKEVTENVDDEKIEQAKTETAAKEQKDIDKKEQKTETQAIIYEADNLKKESNDQQIEQQTESKIADTNTVVKTGEDNESKAELLNQEESRGEEMENSTRTEKQNNPEEINQENEFMGGFILPTSNEEEDKCDDDDFFRGVTYTDEDVEPEFTDDYDINAAGFDYPEDYQEPSQIPDEHVESDTKGHAEDSSASTATQAPAEEIKVIENITPQELFTANSVKDKNFGELKTAYGPSLSENDKLVLAATCESDIAGTNPLSVEYAYDDELDMYGILVYIYDSNKYWFITEGSETFKETLWHLFTRDRLKITANYPAVLNYINNFGIKPTNLISLTALYAASHTDISRILLNKIVKPAETEEHTIKRFMSRYIESYTQWYSEDIVNSDAFRKCMYCDNLMAYSFDISDLVDVRGQNMTTTNYKDFVFTYSDDMEKVGKDIIITYATNPNSLFGINPEEMYWNVIKRMYDNHMFIRFSIRILSIKDNELIISCPQHLTKNISDAVIDYIKKSAKKLNKQVIPQINIAYK